MKVIVYVRVWMMILMVVSFGNGQTGKSKSTKKSDQDIRSALSTSGVRDWAKKFSETVYSTASEATQVEELIKKYSGATVAKLNPEEVADVMKERMEKYLEKRKIIVKHLKEQFETARHEYRPKVHDVLNNENDPEFFRYFDAKNGSDGVSIGRRDGAVWMPPKNYLDYKTNPNFFNMQVDLQHSAVHVPTPIYPRNITILNEIKWTEGLEKKFRDIRNRNYTSASWLFFCSKMGFMRFYPAAPWIYDRPEDTPPLDLYDCRTTEWYIDGATNAKNVVILLDVSGSMLGQRYEIAKKTINTILDTLSENDFFNILVFNEECNYLYEPFNGRLVQATLRNKHLIRKELERFKEIKQIAKYDRALPVAFQLLQKYENYTKVYGCHSSIMLITDGADDFFEDIFDLYNRDKKIRFFSFLMGEDVTDFREVRWMACKNYGYFAHIANLADVQEKVQQYISVMTRPLAEQNETRAIWTGAYYDRLSMETKLENITQFTMTGEERFKVRGENKGRRLVTTVAYPVIHNRTFLGVVGASAPIAELQQRAPPYMLGANSYAFVVDNNGYIMFHPQLRPMVGFKPKPNYNSIDIMEVEVADEHEVDNETEGQTEPNKEEKMVLKEPLDYFHPLRIHLVDASSSKDLPDDKKISMTVLYTMDGHDGLKRVYRQKHRYYYRGINQTLLSLGLAISEGSEFRVDPPHGHKFPLKEINEKWFEGENWRLHPDWHYCIPNDTDTRPKEIVFKDYVKSMKEKGNLPESCASFDFLVNRLLYDAKVTCEMDMCWVGKSKLDSKKGIMLAFLATQNGLTRYVDMNFADLNSDGSPASTNDSVRNTKCTAEEQPYMHFIERSTRTVDEMFYRRAMQFQDGEFVFDVNVTNRVCLVSNSSSRLESMRRKDRYSVLVTVSRSVFLTAPNGAKAPVGVVGIELLYNSLGSLLTQATSRICEPGSDYSCFLLDEHGYIVYSSYRPKDADFTDRHKGRTPGVSPDVGRFFAKTVWSNSGINSFLMRLMINSGIYQKVTYVDFQAMCPEKSTTVSASNRLLNPLYSLAKFILWAFKELSTLLAEYSVWSIVSGFLMPTEAYLTSSLSQLREVSEGVVCDMVHTYYLLDRKFQGSKMYTNKATRGCGMSCRITAVVSRVEKTNLMMVIYTTGMTTCNDGCMDKAKDTIDHGAKPVYNATDKVFDEGASAVVRPRHRRAPADQCYPMETIDEDNAPPCSGSVRVCGMTILGRFLIPILSLALSRLMLGVR